MATLPPQSSVCQCNLTGMSHSRERAPVPVHLVDECKCNDAVDQDVADPGGLLHQPPFTAGEVHLEPRLA